MQGIEATGDDILVGQRADPNGKNVYEVEDHEGNSANLTLVEWENALQAMRDMAKQTRVTEIDEAGRRFEPVSISHPKDGD